MGVNMQFYTNLRYSSIKKTEEENLSPEVGVPYLLFIPSKDSFSSYCPVSQQILMKKVQNHSPKDVYLLSSSADFYYDDFNAYVNIMVQMYRTLIPQDTHNILCCEYPNEISAVLIVFTEKTSDNTTNLAKNRTLQCSGITEDVLGYLKGSCIFDYYTPTGTLKTISVRDGTVLTSSSISRQTGFFLGAGYVEKSSNEKVLRSTFTTNGQYIGIDKNDSYGCFTSNLFDSLDDRVEGEYSNIYQLTPKDELPYYVEVYNSRGGTSESNYQSLDLSETNNLKEYSNITDFSKWNLNIIKNSSFNGSFKILDKENKIIEITSDSVGGNVEYEKIKTPKIKLNSYEVDNSEFFKTLDDTMDKIDFKLIISNGQTNITLQEYFELPLEDREQYKFTYQKDLTILNNFSFYEYLEEIKYSLIEEQSVSFDVNMGLRQETNKLNLYSFKLFEVYTRGNDFIQENYTIVRPEERDPEDSSETSRVMSYSDGYFPFKYSGRDVDIFCGKKKDSAYVLTNTEGGFYYAMMHSCDLLQEDDVTLGETYEERDYFIEAASVYELNTKGEQTGVQIYKDTFKITDYLEPEKGIFDPTKYTEDDIEVHTGHIDLTQCEFYHPLDATYENNWCDCGFYSQEGISTVECMYQKVGYCPYRFQTEKHPRRIRTLQESQSNRFNISQDICGNFGFYPYYYIEHTRNGKCILDENGNMKKHIFFATNKGGEQDYGFRYEKNLKSMSRTLDSTEYTTKLYVESNDSEYSENGLCTIQTAPDNISRTSYILDFSYYTEKGMLDAEQTQRDLYGISEGDFAFLPRIGEYNKKYDDYSNLIITMTGETLVDLQAEITVCATGITTALSERQKVSQSMYQYKISAQSLSSSYEINYSYQSSESYTSYMVKYREQATILWGNVEQLFYSGNYFSYPTYNKDTELYSFDILNYESSEGASIVGIDEEDYDSYRQKYCKGEFFWRLILEGFGEDSSYIPPFDSWEDFKEKIVETKLYESNGMMGRYRSLYNEVKYWKCERAKILNKINDLSNQFSHRYEPYIKESFFSDSNYLDDNEYYWAGVQALRDSCQPKVSYTFDVVDLYTIGKPTDFFDFNLGDTTFVEDIDFFGINNHTGMPNREQVIISAISYDLDNPTSNSITVQNYTSRFEDLWESICVNSQSVTLNENVYKRASNFTSQQYIETDSLQSTLDIGDLTLLSSSEQSLILNDEGLTGSDINNQTNQYDIRSDGIYFSSDGGETWDYGVGSEGINMDYAYFGQLDVSKIQIIDSDYIYFLWDSNGITAYRNPSQETEGLKDFCRFNKYGLSLVEDDKIRCRTGYEFRGEDNNGDIHSEEELSDQNVGFYLYDNSGNTIFKTETKSLYSGDDSDYSARLSLTGEIFVTNERLESIINNDSIKSQSYVLQDQYSFDMEQEYSLKQVDKTISPFVYFVYDIYHNYEGFRFYSIDEDGNYKDEGDTIYLEQTEEGYSWNGKIKAIEVESVGQDEYYCVTTISTIVQIMSEDRNSITIQEFFDDDVVNEKYDVIISNTSSTQESISLNQEGCISQINTRYVFTEEFPDNNINTNSYDIVEMTYYQEGIEKTENFYSISQGGDTTYWKELLNEEGTSSIKAGSKYSAGIGIYLNNKKTINSLLSNYEDKTLYYESDGSEDNHREVILSGAEREFLIAEKQESPNINIYNNIISVLKNGTLYLGGTILNSDGTTLENSKLAQLPDEVKILGPRMVLSSNGYLYCQWDKFFNLIVNDDNTVSFGTNSLYEVLNSIQSGLVGISGSGGTSGSAGCYFDEAEIDANIQR